MLGTHPHTLYHPRYSPNMQSASARGRSSSQCTPVILCCMMLTGTTTCPKISSLPQPAHSTHQVRLPRLLEDSNPRPQKQRQYSAASNTQQQEKAPRQTGGPRKTHKRPAPYRCAARRALLRVACPVPCRCMAASPLSCLLSCSSTAPATLQAMQNHGEQARDSWDS